MLPNIANFEECKIDSDLRKHVWTKYLVHVLWNINKSFKFSWTVCYNGIQQSNGQKEKDFLAKWWHLHRHMKNRVVRFYTLIANLG